MKRVKMDYPTRIFKQDVKNINIDELGKFGVIIADCPWSYSNKDDANRHPDRYYNGMSTAELCKIPVPDLSTKDGVLYLWGTWPLLPDCMQVLKAWGYDYISGFPWIKLKDDFTLAQGMTGYWVYGVSEYVLIGKRGNAKPPTPDGRYLGLIAPNLKHSRKPESVHQIAEALPGPYLELFARRSKKGWTCLGNQIDGSSNEIKKEIAKTSDMFS